MSFIHRHKFNKRTDWIKQWDDLTTSQKNSDITIKHICVSNQVQPGTKKDCIICNPST